MASRQEIFTEWFQANPQKLEYVSSFRQFKHQFPLATEDEYATFQSQHPEFSVKLFYNNLTYYDTIQQIPGMSPEGYFEMIKSSDKIDKLKEYYDLAERIKSDTIIFDLLSGKTIEGTCYSVELPDGVGWDFKDLGPFIGSLLFAESAYEDGIDEIHIHIQFTNSNVIDITTISELLDMDGVLQIELGDENIKPGDMINEVKHEYYSDILEDGDWDYIIIHFDGIGPYALGG